MSAETKPSEESNSPEPPSDEKEPKRKRRGCLRKLFLFALITFPILGSLINGPIFRWLAEYGIKKGAESVGLTGDVTVKGTILSGFELQDAEFTGDGSGEIESLAIGNAGIDYSIYELITTGGLAWLHEVRLSDADVSIALNEKTEPKEIPEEAKEEPKPDDGKPSVLWQLLETRYSLKNINLRITQGDKLYEVDNLTLTIPEGGAGKLSIARLEIPGADPRSAIETDIKVTPASLTLGPLRIVDAVEITALTLKQTPANEPFLTAKLGLSGGSLDATYTADGAISAKLTKGAISLPELLALAQIENLKSGSIENLDIQFTGDFGAPATWNSDVALGFSTLQWGTARADKITLTAILKPENPDDGRLQLTIARAGATLDATAKIPLSQTESPADLASLPLHIDAKLAVEAIENVIADYLPEGAKPMPATGSLTGDLTIEINDKKLVATHADLHSKTLAYDGVAIDSVSVIADLEKLESLVFDADIALDEESKIALDGTLDPNTLDCTAKADLRVSTSDRLKLLLTKFGIENEVQIEGALIGVIEADVKDKKLVKSHVDLRSEALTYEGIPIDSISLVADLEKPGEPLVFDADIALDKETLFGVNGTLDPNTLAYDGKADLRAAVAGRLKDLLPKLGFEKELEITTTVDWKGDGNIKKKQHRGETKIVANGVRYAGATPFDALVEGTYEDLDIALTNLVIVSEPLQFASSFSYRDSVLELPELRLLSGDLLLLEGHLKTPLDLEALKTPAGYFTQTGEVDVDIESHDLALESILGLFQQEPPANCRIGLNLKASGSPSNLDLTGSFTADDITIPDNEIPPAQAEINISIKDAVANLSGRIDQPQIEPLTLEGTMPFAPAAWVDGSRDPMAEPVSFSAKIKESQLAFLAAYSPAIDTLDGIIDIDVALSGTLNQPTVVGKADLRVDSLRASSAQAPSVRDFVAALRFEEQVLHIDKLSAILAGGKIGMGGSIGFPIGADPEFDLRLGGHEVLVFRSDSLSARTNLDLSLKGPFSTAALSGTIGITSSLFYKDIDLLPIGGIGRGGGKSALPPVESAPNMPWPKSLDVGVPLEPFQNWPVDIKIVTSDPFRVAGNVAQAAVLCDLSIGGTLGTPVPDGKIWVSKGRVSLPFSKIDFSQAEVLFDEVTGFNGSLGVRAESKVGDYRVSIFAHNRILDPKIVFTSIPPLPRQDILTLIASGVTRQELTDGGGTAATKAFIYWLKSLSNKEGKIDPDAPPTFAETLEERTDVSFGAVDPDTGEMGVSASIRLWRQSYAAFSLGKQGSQRGVLKYIFRFR